MHVLGIDLFNIILMCGIFLTVDKCHKDQDTAMDCSPVPFEQSHKEMVVHLLVPAEWSLCHSPPLCFHHPVMLRRKKRGTMQSLKALLCIQRQRANKNGLDPTKANAGFLQVKLVAHTTAEGTLHYS